MDELLSLLTLSLQNFQKGDKWITLMTGHIRRSIALLLLVYSALNWF